MAKIIPKVSGMDWIVEKFTQVQMEPDEFTADIIAKKTKTTKSSVRHRLQRMKAEGELTSRKILQNGQWINIYRKAPARVVSLLDVNNHNSEI
jgi:response regulator of citrate/malate metabolism